MGTNCSELCQLRFVTVTGLTRCFCWPWLAQMDAMEPRVRLLNYRLHVIVVGVQNGSFCLCALGMCTRTARVACLVSTYRVKLSAHY
jgi:hypothetical protein